MIQDTDPLSALRDIHLPEPVPFWPPAIGWWITLALVLALVVAAGWLQRRRRRSLRLAALHELASLSESFEASGDVQGLALGLSDLLRRVALARFPRQDVASLYGKSWAEFLSNHASDPELVSRAAAELEVALYSNPESIPCTEPERWIGATRAWIGGVA